jgi:hypothetical protein
MNPNCSTASLRSVLALSEKRDGFLAEIVKIDAEISSVLGSGFSVGNAKLATSGHKTSEGRKAGWTARTAIQAVVPVS